MRNDRSARNGQRLGEGDGGSWCSWRRAGGAANTSCSCSPNSGVTGSSPSPLLSQHPPRSVFHGQNAPPDWCWAGILQEVTQPVLLQEPSPNPGSTIPSPSACPWLCPPDAAALKLFLGLLESGSHRNSRLCISDPFPWPCPDQDIPWGACPLVQQQVIQHQCSMAQSNSSSKQNETLKMPSEG